MVSVMDKQLIPAGYKQTEVGVIPEDWNVCSMLEIAHLERGKFSARPRNDPKFFNGSTPFIQTGDITRSKGNDVTYTQTLNDEGVKVSRVFQANTLFFTIAANIGDVAIVPYSVACPDSLVAINTRLHVSKFWLLQVLKSRKKEFEMLATSNAQLNINLEKLNPYLLPVPNIHEQTAIANALSDVDALIAALEKLIAKKSAIKTAAMQQLLTGKKRLPPFDQLNTGYKQTELGEIPADWDVKNLDSYCASFKTGKLDANVMTSNGQYRFYTCAKNFSWIDYYAFDTEALLVSGNGANVGYVHYYKGKFNAYQRTYVLSDFSADILYLKVYLEQRLADRIRVEVNSGNTPYITMDTLTEMSILIPKDKAEQTVIANVLSDMDKELEALQQRLHKTQEIKQGMMQELLLGKTRLLKPLNQEYQHG